MGKLGAGLDLNEKHKPVGSLFLEAMDRDSIPPRVRRSVYRRLADRSLPNTPFSFYPDEPGRTRAFSASGRRHFPVRSCDNPVAPDPPEVSSARRAVPRQETSHLDSAAQAINEIEPVHYSRQRCRQPPFNKSPVRVPHPRALVTSSPLRRSHLSLGSLAPIEEPRKERPVPPPLIKKPLRFGRRHTPEPRSVSAEHRRVGIKMVPPPSHWESATERRMAFTNLGVGAYKVNGIQHRNQSNWEIGFSSPLRLHRCMSTESRGNDSATAPNDEVPWRGRRYSSSPRRRTADIISWMPLKYC
ncbi:uncharacterized protein Tco025E_05051 [Trypanosoma conorhini]|uniref:Uncharacterized protein n=1 Tax=Trypanosoma conorhini TaxID=83891 RepID=A0A3R7N632_9TRYP|nr:uncharacterized protein Tco025E_05051 [Trypanosoma conorhini]RNF16760.1 hypothetical protein Tco025E_05051 [Trypanosoma conorhini]